MITFDQESGDTVRVKGADIYYEVHGEPGGFPLLLLHGGLGSMGDLNGFAHRLPSGFRLIGIDFRGHGGSTLGTVPLTYAQYQEDVEAVLARLGIDSVAVIGFSDGGIVGYRMASAGGVRVVGLATLGAQWRLLPDDPAMPMLQGMTAERWRTMFPDSVAKYEGTNPRPDFDALVKAVVSLWTDLTPSGYPRGSVKSIRCPLLIARGDNDHLFSLDEASGLQAQVAGAGLFNIPFAGHAAFEESPEVFVAGVNAFLASLGIAEER